MCQAHAVRRDGGAAGIVPGAVVNWKDGRADLLALTDNACALPDVPFAKLRPYRRTRSWNRISAGPFRTVRLVE
jgi:hypothetical protein